MDFHAKCQIIERIVDEVNELHPLLRDVLNKLKSIERVHYTHGPDEKGADFVLTRRDPALESTSHIGVVVKVGKIHQNMGDLERQIDECGMPRKINGGREDVRLTEIWIVTTQGITRNAKDKIFEKFSKHKVEFIDGEQLAKLVDTHAAWYWHNVPSPIGTYLATVSKRMGELDHELNLLSALECDDFYVDPDIQEIEKIAYVKNRRFARPSYVELWDEVRKHRVCMLEGDMGYGKSKTARVLINQFCAPERFKSEPWLPIFLSYKAFRDRYAGDVAACLNRELADLWNSAKEGQAKVILVLDGIDEAVNPDEDWLEILKLLLTNAKEFSYLHILLTTRPLRHINEVVTLGSSVKRLSLRPMSLNKVVKFIEKACQKFNLPKKLFEDLQRSELFKHLPNSPIAAALLSSLLAQNQHDLPSNMTELYAKSIDLMLGRWDIQKKVSTEKEYQVIERVALHLTQFMVRNRLIWMSEVEASLMVDDWISRRNLQVDAKAVFARLLDRTSIFARDADTGVIGFRHRSFGEYLFARGAARDGQLPQFVNALEPYWIYPQFFFIGTKGDCREIVSSLFEQVPKDEIEAWIKVLVMPDYILAGHQTEYAVIETNLYRLFIDAARLYGEIRRGNTQTRLTELPEMHLLWFFQRLIRYCFDYEYFRKAIEITLLKIDAADVDSGTKILALFFAAAFAAELKDGSGFEYMLKSYGSQNLPLSISIAIDIEKNMNKDFAKLPLIKQHEKKLHAMLGMHSGNKKNPDSARDSITIRGSIGDLFDKPVKARPPVKKA